MKIEHLLFQKPRIIQEKGDIVACYFCKKPCTVGYICPWCGKPSPGPDVSIEKGF